ncbi:hypothetical protein BDN71DRAFT_1512653 [Pleurotus eryngii]|uniref:Uncharacterized protein n=1 Tax=Pleurotus eryngii TaxID=5323 RepID=A0A9P5ZIT5_PLEER|nr:hypothetical protein BDN71DRAFT_1512653 [Pleurotus eryngii]
MVPGSCKLRVSIVAVKEGPSARPCSSCNRAARSLDASTSQDLGSWVRYGEHQGGEQPGVPYPLLYYAVSWKSLKAGVCLVSERGKALSRCGRGRELSKESSERQDISRTFRVISGA